MGDGDRQTKELRRPDMVAIDDSHSDPPTAVTNLREILDQLKGNEHWTVTVLSGANSGLVVPLDRDVIVVGRGSEADIRLPDDGLSRKHAEISRKGLQLRVRDLGSTNGTFVNGERVTGHETLADGAWVQLGSTALRVNVRSEVETAAARKLYESSVRDPLTSLYNRRHFDERILAEFAFARRHRKPLSLLMIDVDHFKRLNDTFGHQAGDEVLRVVADLLGDSVREEDVVARYGGEEFVVVLRGVDAGGADILAQRIRQRIEDLVVDWEESKLNVTVSIGVATHMAYRPYEDPTALTAAADECLYRAKAAGRNIVVADASPRRSSPPT